MMHLYDIGILAGEDGRYGLDVRQEGSTGSAPFLEFSNWPGLVAFFSSAGLAGDMLSQIDEIGLTLTKGSAYRSKVFLPETFDHCLADAHGRCSSLAVPMAQAATA